MTSSQISPKTTSTFTSIVSKRDLLIECLEKGLTIESNELHCRGVNCNYCPLSNKGCLSISDGAKYLPSPLVENVKENYPELFI